MKKTINFTVTAAMIAAIYAALTLISPIVRSTLQTRPKGRMLRSSKRTRITKIDGLDL